jgi:hypothetical protein
MKYILCLLCFISSILLGCKNDEDVIIEEVIEKNNNYPNGTYCADVSYYNPNNETEHTYILNVEVEDNQLTKINWNNGGWLDDSHFNSSDLNEDGYCSFTSNNGYKYNIQIRGPRCNNTDIIPLKNTEEEKPSYTLINCGESKGFTEEEIQYCEQKFGTQRENEISEEQCNLLSQSIENYRELKKMNTEIDNGKIQQSLRIGSEGNIRFRQLIVKRMNTFYLLDVQGNNEVISGLIDFNPYSREWQIATVKISFNTIQNGYNMKVLNENTDIKILEEESKQNLINRTRDGMNLKY